MKKFDLELVKAGHPVKTNGKSITYIGYNPVSKKLLYVRPNGNIISSDVNGNRGSDRIVMDTSKGWERPLKCGDKIEVLDEGWNTVTFVRQHEGSVLYVPKQDDDEWENCDDEVWLKSTSNWRRISETYEIEIDVKIKGKLAKLSDISKETLEKLRELDK